MATATATHPALPDDALVELLSLVKGADSVELKLTVPESSHRPRGIDLGGQQQARTRKALEFFSAQLRADASA
jgi:hypothetical protein